MFKVMVACSVVCTVFILNFHERTVDTHEVSTRNLKNHMKTRQCVFLWSFWITFENIELPPRCLTGWSVFSSSGCHGCSGWTGLEDPCLQSQSCSGKKKCLRFFVASLNFLARQRLRQLEQGDKPAHPGLVTPGRIENVYFPFSLAPLFYKNIGLLPPGKIVSVLLINPSLGKY